MILNDSERSFRNDPELGRTWVNMNMNVDDRYESSRTMFTHELFNDRY